MLELAGFLRQDINVFKQSPPCSNTNILISQSDRAIKVLNLKTPSNKLATRVFVFTLLLLPFLFFNASAQTKKLVVSNEEDGYLLYDYYTQGKLAGATVEILVAFTTKLGYTVKYEHSPWSSANQHLRLGRIGLVFIY